MELQYRNQKDGWGWVTVAWPPGKKQNSNPSTKERSSTELRVSLRSSLDYELAWSAVKTSEYVCQVFFSGFLITTLSFPHKRSTRISTSNPGRNKRAQRRASRDQGCQIFIFVINNPVLPTTEYDANPLERQRSYGGVMILTSCALLLVVGAGPFRFGD